MLQEKFNEEDQALKTRFKANKVPITSKVPMFDNIMKNQQERRQKVKE